MKLNSTIALGIIGAIAALIIYSIHLTTVKWPAEQARNQYAYDQAASAPENLLLVCPPSHDGKPITPEQCKRSGQYEHDRRQQISDHRAQISMKYAAWWTVAFTFVGLILVGYTLQQTSRAAKLAVGVLDEAKTATGIAKDGLQEAKLATISAKKSLSVTKSTSYKELRAYLGVALKAVPIKSGDEKLAVSVTIKNFGQTPAYNIEFAHAINFVSLEWGGLTTNHTTAILNPTESFDPIFKSKKTNMSNIGDTDTVYLHLSIGFIDMNGKKRWIKVVFSKGGSDWPIEGHSSEVDLTMYLVKMETGDMDPDESYSA